MAITDNVSDTAQSISNLGKTIGDFFSSVGDIILTIVNIIKAIWFGFISLVSGVWDLILNVFEGGVFNNVADAFVYISSYIGGPATVFISCLLIVIFLRIFIAFIFKLLRLNIDYHSLQVKDKGWKYKYEKMREHEE